MIPVMAKSQLKHNGPKQNLVVGVWYQSVNLIAYILMYNLFEKY